jgi:hypothetical protein
VISCRDRDVNEARLPATHPEGMLSVTPPVMVGYARAASLRVRCVCRTDRASGNLRGDMPISLDSGAVFPTKNISRLHGRW